MFFNREIEKRESVDVNDWKDVYSFEKGYESDYAHYTEKESTYFSCLKLISENISKCYLEIKQETEKGEITVKNHYLYNKLRLRPNLYMSAINCYTTFVKLAKHKGQAGLLINRAKNGKIKDLYPVKLTYCTIDDMGLIKGTKNNKILWDWESIDGESGSAFDKDIIVLRDNSIDGIKGRATRKIVNKSLDTSIESQEYLNKLFKNGLTSKLAVQLSSDIKDEKELTKIQEKFNRIYSTNGRVFTIPASYNIKPLNLSLADSQFAELRKLSKEEIATAMGVPLSKLNIKQETAKNNENDNLDFWSDCLQYIITQIEMEMDWKILTENERKKGYKIRFNVDVLLRTDKPTQSDILTKYVEKGIYTINEAREILGKKKLDVGDHVFMPSGQVCIDALINGNVSYQKGGGKDDNARTD